MSATMRTSGRLGFRRRVLGLYGTAGLLALLAVALRTPVPLFAALPLLLAPAAATLEKPRAAAMASLVWSSGGEAGAVEISGELRPSRGLSPAALEITFLRPEALRESRPPEVTVTDEVVRFTLHWRAPFPCLAEVEPPHVVWRDALGLSEAGVGVEATPLTIERFPPEVTRVGSIRLRRTTSLPGETRSKAVGGAGEFFALRASAPGDTPKQINWRATARMGRLLSNDYYLERTGDLLILLDLRPSSLGEERDRQILSISRAAAMGIASGFLDEKARVGLATFDEFVSAVPLGTGRRQKYRLSQALQATRLGTVSGPSERFAVSLRRYFPPGVTTLLLSTLNDEESMTLLPHLRRRGFSPFVLSPSPLPLLAPESGKETASDLLAMRLLQLLRRRRVQEGWKEAPVVEWDDYWSLAPLVHYLTAPTRNRRVA
ncbi:MAG: DUF58 domain-containing protein [Thermoplasmata archaeon]|nr:DUF58 domain-containing protein [Thermoplasmata archaeon]